MFTSTGATRHATTRMPRKIVRWISKKYVSFSQLLSGERTHVTRQEATNQSSNFTAVHYYLTFFIVNCTVYTLVLYN